MGLLALLLAAATTFVNDVPQRTCKIFSDYGACTAAAGGECRIDLPEGGHDVAVRECRAENARVIAGLRYHILDGVERWRTGRDPVAPGVLAAIGILGGGVMLAAGAIQRNAVLALSGAVLGGGLWGLGVVLARRSEASRRSGIGSVVEEGAQLELVVTGTF